MRQFRAMLWMAIVAQVLLPSAPRAQVPDHLKCYKIKDSVAKATYTADLGGLAPEPGCLVKVPGKLLCVEATKTNVSPTPPGAPAGPAAGTFVCYKVKCPKGLPPAVTVTDQFATRTVSPSAAQMLCAPAQVEGPTTTTTTNPATTTTTSSTTTTMLATTTTTTTAGSTTTLPANVVCCAFTSGANSVCTYLPLAGQCAAEGGVSGATGSVCDGSTGGCTASATPGNCCGGPQGATTCFAGPSITQTVCTTQPPGGMGGTFFANATCTFNGSNGFVCQ